MIKGSRQLGLETSGKASQPKRKQDLTEAPYPALLAASDLRRHKKKMNLDIV